VLEVVGKHLAEADDSVIRAACNQIGQRSVEATKAFHPRRLVGLVRLPPPLKSGHRLWDIRIGRAGGVARRLRIENENKMVGMRA